MCLNTKQYVVKSPLGEQDVVTKQMDKQAPSASERHRDGASLSNHTMSYESLTFVCAIQDLLFQRTNGASCHKSAEDAVRALCHGNVRWCPPMTVLGIWIRP